MKILYDHQAFTMQSYGGVSRYFVNLANEIFKLKHKAEIFAPIHRNIHLTKIPLEISDGIYFKKFFPKTVFLVNFYNSLKLKRSIINTRPDLLHKTYYRKNKFEVDNLPVVITVYDMTHELFKENFPVNDFTSKYKYDAVKRADHIICISENTKKDLMELYHVSSKKISVVYLASDLKRLDSFDNNDKFIPFILYVGQRHGYKNFDKFITSVSLSKKLIKNFQIICFGGGNFTKDELNKINSLGFYDGQVKQIFGDDSLLVSLYLSATTLVYPSLYEGFGLPLLEAMSNGCPVLCSNTSSLPEVAGNAAIYFNPNNVEEMSSVIETLVFSNSQISKMKKLGLERCGKFSWSLCAQKTLEVYNEVIKK